MNDLSRSHDMPAQLASPAPRDQEIWLLNNKIEQLHRSASALRGLIGRSGDAGKGPVTLAPVVKGPAPSKPAPKPEAEGEARPWWPTTRLPERRMQPPPGFDCTSLGSSDLPALEVNVLGLRAADLDHAVCLIAEEQLRSPNFKPVFLTDSPDFTPMVRRGYVVEHLQEGDLATAGDWGIGPGPQAFLERKWGITGHVDLRSTRAPDAAPAPAARQVARPEGAAPAAISAPARRKRAAVISWDLGHNPAGRAMVLYDLLAQDHDVELIGPLWSRFGGKVWGPIADSARKVRGFPCETLEDFWPAALGFAASAQFDLVIVCKPRLPGLLLGALLKKACGCPLVLDVDDFELSFFPNETELSLTELEKAGLEALKEPYGELATRACESLIREADALTVSNIALRNRYGGTIVRHARDEIAFSRDQFDRAAERARMGMQPEDFALVFVGTARAHKGVFDIARTLDQMQDKRFVLHLVGDIPDRRVRNELDRHRGARIVYHPNCPFEALPAKIVAADAVALLQDVCHPISKYQIPAKVSDASAFGLPILATDVPPLRDLALQGVVTTLSAPDLGPALLELAQARDSGASHYSVQRVREAFEAELGFRVNRERLGFAVARAASAGAGLPLAFERLLDLATRAHAALRAERLAATRKVSPRKMKATERAPVDIVMFWKQNDTGIYGRRSDMVMKHLLASGRVGRILQIDAPMEIGQLAHAVEGEAASVGRRILTQVVDNQYGLRDSNRHAFRTFLWDKRRRVPLLPQVARSLEDYPDWVAAQMKAAGIRPEAALAWVCPVVFDFPAIARRIPFRGIVGDLIDDQRQFEMQPAYRQRIIKSYEDTLPLFDLTFTNCAPVAQAFQALTPEIKVVPNGTEIETSPDATLPAALAQLKGPVAGYVGNLRDRFDWALLRDTAQLLPDVTFAIVGGGARERDLEVVQGLSNITFTGVVPYDQVQTCMRAFDVALVLHTRDELTDRMNPLKIYNYFAAGRKIVSTEVDNIDPGIRQFMRFATTAQDFAAAITAALASPAPAGREFERILSRSTWKNRVRRILSELDAVPGLMP